MAPMAPSFAALTALASVLGRAVAKPERATRKVAAKLVKRMLLVVVRTRIMERLVWLVEVIMKVAKVLLN